MKTEQAKRQSTIDGPKESGKFTLYPATFGLLEWFQTTRKNPLIVGGKSELKHVIELCWSFTVPSATACATTPAKLTAAVQAFSHQLTPGEFQRIQKHAETELLKFQQTAVAPKKPRPARPKRQKVKR